MGILIKRKSQRKKIKIKMKIKKEFRKAKPGKKKKNLKPVAGGARTRSLHGCHVATLQVGRVLGPDATRFDRSVPVPRGAKRLVRLDFLATWHGVIRGKGITLSLIWANYEIAPGAVNLKEVVQAFFLLHLTELFFFSSKASSPSHCISVLGKRLFTKSLSRDPYYLQERDILKLKWREYLSETSR